MYIQYFHSVAPLVVCIAEPHVLGICTLCLYCDMVPLTDGPTNGLIIAERGVCNNNLIFRTDKHSS